jgi:uncharacterized protein
MMAGTMSIAPSLLRVARRAGSIVLASLATAACAQQAPPPRLPAEPVVAPRGAEIPAEAPVPVLLDLPCSDTDLAGCTRGCEKQHQEDCVTLGSMYLAGAGVAVDQERAIALFRAACEETSARGCIRLADVYHAGILKGDAEETALYRRACEGGANLGCVAAGKAHLEGRGVTADPATAARLFDKVCQRGNGPGCFELGRLYEQGDGVSRDAQRAFNLFAKACKLGYDEGCLYASRTEEVLPPRN